MPRGAIDVRRMNLVRTTIRKSESDMTGRFPFGWPQELLALPLGKKIANGRLICNRPDHASGHDGEDGKSLTISSDDHVSKFKTSILELHIIPS